MLFLEGAFFLKLFPAIRYIHAKKRGIPLLSGLGSSLSQLFFQM